MERAIRSRKGNCITNINIIPFFLFPWWLHFCLYNTATDATAPEEARRDETLGIGIGRGRGYSSNAMPLIYSFICGVRWFAYAHCTCTHIFIHMENCSAFGWCEYDFNLQKKTFSLPFIHSARINLRLIRKCTYICVVVCACVWWWVKLCIYEVNRLLQHILPDTFSTLYLLALHYHKLCMC